MADSMDQVSRETELQAIARKWKHVPTPVDVQLLYMQSLSLLRDIFDDMARDWVDAGGGSRMYPHDKSAQMEAQYVAAMRSCFLVGMDYAPTRDESSEPDMFSPDEIQLMVVACRPVAVTLGNLLPGPDLNAKDRERLVHLQEGMVGVGGHCLILGRNAAVRGPATGA
jgi:hypothetical protein